jgi:hypothetical protein
VEIAGAHFVEPGVGVGVRVLLEPLHRYVAAPAVSRQERHQPRGHRRDAGNAAQFLLDPSEEDAGARRGVAAQLGRDPEGEDMVGFDAQVHPAHVQEALDEEPRRGEEGHRERNLRRDQGGAEPVGAPGADDRPGVGANGGDEVGSGAVQGGEHAEQQPGADGDHGGEDEDGGLDPELHREPTVGGKQRRNGAQSPAHHQEAGRTAEYRQDARLQQQLAEEVGPSGAERQPDRHLHGAIGAPGQEEVGDVGAGNHQHQRRQRKEQGQRRLGFAGEGALAPPPVRQGHGLGLEQGHGLLAHPLLQRGLDLGEDRPVDPVDSRPGLLQGDAGLEPGEQVRPVAPPVVESVESRVGLGPHRDRHEDLGVAADRGPGKSAGCHPDDRVGMAVDDDRLAHDAPVGAELGGPVLVAQDRNEAGPGRLVIRRGEQASGGRCQAQHGKVGPGHQESRPIDRSLALGRQVRAEVAVSRDAGEDRLGLFQVAKHRVAPHLGAVARLAAGLGTGIGPRRGQVHQLGGVRRRQGAKEELVEERKDRGVGSDAESQRPDRDSRDERRAEQRPERQLEIGHRRSC